MQATVLIYYSLASVSVISACAVAILNGLCYATSESLPPESTAIELTIIGLHALSCIELIVLALLLGRNVKSGLADWTGLKTWICCCIGVFLLINTAAAAGAVAWGDLQSSLGGSQAMVISQCVIWAASVFNQGLFCGFLLFFVTKTEHCCGWRYTLQRDLEARYRSSGKGKGKPMLSPLHYDRQVQSPPTSPKTMPGRLSPVQSFSANVTSPGLNRYSGGTLFPLDSKHDSFDTYSPESPSMRMRRHARQTSYDTCSTISENSTWRRHKNHSEVKSLDSIVLQPSTPTGPSITTDPAKSWPMKQNTSCEDHIHPLFRTGSASPPPTPAPGTTLTASPVAGRTISTKTLHRLRSSRSIQAGGDRPKLPANGGRRASFEDSLQESDNWPLPMLGITSLNESPYES